MAKESEVKITQNIFAKKGAEQGARKSIVETMVKVHAQAVALCPVDLGQLRNSLMWEIKGEEGGFNTVGGSPADKKLTTNPEKLVGYVGTNSDHWYPEFGTRNQVAQPFLRPAGDAVRGASAKEIGIKYGREAMEEAFRRKKVRKIR